LQGIGKEESIYMIDIRTIFPLKLLILVFGKGSYLNLGYGSMLQIFDRHFAR
jgi:hypothetical protein